jgi:hypothetical protein
MKRREGPVPKLPDLRGLQAKVIAADERAQKPVKPPPFINCPSKPIRSISTPDLQQGRKRELAALLAPSVMPRPQRRLTAARPRLTDDMPGLGELRERHVIGAARHDMSLPPLADFDGDSPGKKATIRSKRMVRSLEAQQGYIDQYLAAPPKPKEKSELLTMKLEALRKERLARQLGFVPGRQETSKFHEVQEDEESEMPPVKWDELL